jgi:hypothetical protein
LTSIGKVLPAKITVEATPASTGIVMFMVASAARAPVSGPISLGRRHYPHIE